MTFMDWVTTDVIFQHSGISGHFLIVEIKYESYIFCLPFWLVTFWSLFIWSNLQMAYIIPLKFIILFTVDQARWNDQPQSGWLVHDDLPVPVPQRQA